MHSTEVISIEALWGSLTGVLLTGVIGILTYVYQEYAKRQADLSKYKLDLYTELGTSIFKLLVAKPGTDRSNLFSEIERGWLFASDGVLEASYDFLDIYDSVPEEDKKSMPDWVRDDPETRRKLEETLAKLFFEMRRDVKSTKIEEAWAKNRVKIYESGIIADSPEST